LTTVVQTRDAGTFQTTTSLLADASFEPGKDRPFFIFPSTASLLWIRYFGCVSLLV